MLSVDQSIRAGKLIGCVVGVAIFAVGLIYAGYRLDQHAWQSGAIAKCQKENIEC